MAHLLGSVEAQLMPDHGFVIVLGTGFRQTFLPNFTQGRLCYPGDDMLYLMSGTGFAHEDHVVLQAWDAPPPLDPHSEASETAEMLLTEGRLYVSRLMESAASPVLAVGPGGRYDLRVDVTGRSALIDYYTHYQPRQPPACEHLHVRLWPAPSSSLRR
jgi:hypothetical protein